MKGGEVKKRREKEKRAKQERKKKYKRECEMGKWGFGWDLFLYILIQYIEEGGVQVSRLHNKRRFGNVKRQGTR